MSLMLLQVAGTLALFGNGLLQSQSWGDVNVFTNVIYKQTMSTELTLDLYLPAEPVERRPAVLCIHGGAWVVGSKDDWASLCKRLALSGYIAASIDYRKLPEAPYPSGVADARDAVRFLKDNAGVFGLDVDRMAVLGSSAGGQIAGMVAYAPELESLDDSPRSKTIPDVHAAILLYAATNLTDWSSFHVDYVSLYLGKTYEEDPVLYTNASPISYVTPDDPPTLLVHGTVDVIVPFSQSFMLWGSLRESNVPAVLVPRLFKDHGFVKYGPRDKEWFIQLVLGYLEYNL